MCVCVCGEGGGGGTCVQVFMWASRGIRFCEAEVIAELSDMNARDRTHVLCKNSKHP